MRLAQRERKVRRELRDQRERRGLPGLLDLVGQLALTLLCLGLLAHKVLPALKGLLE